MSIHCHIPQDPERLTKSHTIQKLKELGIKLKV